MLKQLESEAGIITPKVLSIQSHVVHGYVGNKAATFPLQYRGWDVDVLNSVQLSNHPGYGKFVGFRSNPKDIRDILKNGLFGKLDMKYDAVLTGYIPCTETLEVINDIIGKVCDDDCQVKWILDPVLGDNGRLYVSEKNVPVYRKILQSNHIFVATPNQFEMETLTSTKIDSFDSLKKSFLTFHKIFPRVEKVVITSMELSLSKDEHDCLLCACYDPTVSPNQAFYFKVPKLNAHFSGSGDLFTALLLDYVAHPVGKEALSLTCALSEVLSLVDKILQRTIELSSEDNGHIANKRSVIKDLRLINCVDLLKKDLAAQHTPKFTPISIDLI